MDIGGVNLSQIPTLEECERIGFNPSEYNVVVAPPRVAEKTAGGIILATESQETMEAGFQLGRLVRVSPIAFNYERWPEGTYPPQEGDVVMYARYAGVIITGQDGNKYRIMKDKDITGTYEIEEDE